MDQSVVAAMEKEDEALVERLRKSTDCSAALAEKLLQGWTLMGEHCPQCITPLMRNRQKKLFCVSCNQWVLTEEEAAGRPSQHRNHQEAQNPHIARIPTGLPSAAEDRNGSQAAAASPEQQPRSPSLLLPKVNLSMKPETVQTLTLTTLIQKMEEIRGLIAATQDVQDLRKLFQTLCECVHTIKTVKTLAGEESTLVKPWTSTVWKE